MKIQYAIVNGGLDISNAYIGLVLKIGDRSKNYYIVIDGYCDLIRAECITFISKEWYDLLLSRNTVMEQWIKDKDQEK